MRHRDTPSRYIVFVAGIDHRLVDIRNLDDSVLGSQRDPQRSNTSQVGTAHSYQIAGLLISGFMCLHATLLLAYR